MGGRNDATDNHLACGDVSDRLQEYVDGTLGKSESLSVFLHLRGCRACRREHEAMREMFALLDSLPAVPAPADFDAPIMEAIPLEAYRAMEPLRRERVPVFLETEFLPAWLRAPATRLAGLVVTLAGVASFAVGQVPDVVLVPAVAGVVPEFLLRIQSLARRATLAVRKAAN